MNKLLAIVIGLLLVALLLLFSMTYTVAYHQVAIKSTFGRTDVNSVITEPGLKFKLPIFADKVTKYDTRLQVLASPLEQIQTADDLQIVVRAFLLWRVDTTDNGGPLKFYNSYASLEEAERGLREDFRSAVKNAASQYSFNDLLGSGSRLPEAEQAILQQMMAAREQGVLPVTAGISQVQLPAKTTSFVLDRMEATREALSSAERLKGNAEADRIKGAARTLNEKIEAFAGRRAADIRAAGNIQAARYLQEMSGDTDLAVFLSWLDALEQSLSQYTTIVLPTSMEPYHLMNLDSPINSAGIPVPEGEAEIYVSSADPEPPAQAGPQTEEADAAADPAADGEQ